VNEIEIGLVVAACLYGFRHGFDLDHLAALGDITGSSATRDRALKLSTLYVVGHALVVFSLGVAAVVAGAFIPASWEASMGRVIGVTLVALGLYLTWSVIRHGGAVRLRSRWMLAADGVRAASKRFRRTGETVVIEHSHEHSHEGSHRHSHPEEQAGPALPARSVVATAHSHMHTHVAALPADPFRGYSSAAAFGVGMLHGIGAETPTQVVLFASAAGAGTTAGGIAVLVSFLAGLVIANSLVAAASALGFADRGRFPRAYVAIALVTAGFSLYLGITYLLGGGAPFTFGA
jgi:cytochrome c biogenesis protein CcdA